MPRAWRRQSLLRDALHPPENVRVIDTTGVEHAVQTVYTGTDEDGIQVYRVVDLPGDVHVAKVLVSRLPGRTSITFPGENT